MVLIAGAVTNLPDAVVVFGFDADVAFIAALSFRADFELKDVDVT